MNKPSVIVIGAGLSGLTAARELTRRGHRVTVFDKGRGLGGRLATRRIENAAFDHGAQFFTVRSEAFGEFLKFWETDCTAKEWFSGYPAPNSQNPDSYPRYRGAPGMTALAKTLARNLDIQLNSLVTRVEKDGRWTVTLESGESLQADWLILTCPVPQALTLLANSELPISADSKSTLDSIQYDPCFALMALLDGPSKIPPPGGLHLDEEILSWIADNHQKGVSPVEGAVTIHASGAWSRENFDTLAEEVASIMLSAAAPWLGGPVSNWQLHRWRYAKPTSPLDIGALAEPGQNLIFAGDAFAGSKVEGAALSGLAAARAIP